MELMKADPDKKFKYTLIDSRRLPRAKSDRLYLPVARGKLRVRLRAGDPRLHKKLSTAYEQTEKNPGGGFYPVGLSRTWHGGVHFRTPKGRETIVACAEGELVAARLGKVDEGKHKFGSGNFILLRHAFKKPTAKPDDKPQYWFSLYMHLQELKGLPWTRRIERLAKLADQPAGGGAAQQAGQSKTAKADTGSKADEAWKKNAKKAKELLDKAKGGDVVLFEPGLVKLGAGARLAYAATYGIPRRRQMHFEVFSASDKDPIIPKDDKHFTHVESKDETGVADVEEILKKIDLDKDKTISADEIRKAYRRKKTAFAMRHMVVSNPSEWFVDWTKALPKSEYWKLALKDDELNKAAKDAQAYNWWDGKLKDWGIGDKVVTHYHPVAFLEYLTDQGKVATGGTVSHFPIGKVWLLALSIYKGKFLK